MGENCAVHVGWYEDVNGFFTNENVNISYASGQLNHSHSHSETRNVLSRAPFNGANLALEFPSLDFAADIDFPQTHHTIFVSADGPRAVGADADASGTALWMRHLQALVVREWLEAIWAGKCRD